MRSNTFRVLVVTATAVWLGGCAPSYSLVKAAPTKVAARKLEVRPNQEWNRAPRFPADIAQEESWTQNGLVLDAIEFIGGLKDGASIVKQGKKDAQKVPTFRSSMGPQDLVSMIESAYRVRGVSVFQTLGIKPAKFLGEDGVQFDYEFVLGDEVRRRGRAVMVIAQGSLYMINLNAAAAHYFKAALPEFESLVSSARFPGRGGSGI